MKSTPPSAQVSHQYFYFYHAMIVIVELLGIAMSIVQQANRDLMKTQPWLAVPEFIIGLLSLVLFVCTIVAFVVWKKKHYPAYTYWAPAVYLGLSMIMGVIGTVWSFKMMMDTWISMGENVDPAAMQIAVESLTIPTWLYLTSYLTAAITLTVTIWVWLKFKKQIALGTTTGAPTK